MNISKKLTHETVKINNLNGLLQILRLRPFCELKVYRNENLKKIILMKIKYATPTNNSSIRLKPQTNFGKAHIARNCVATNVYNRMHNSPALR